MEGSTDFLVGINRISNNDALGRKSCQKVVQTRLQICGERRGIKWICTRSMQHNRAP